MASDLESFSEFTLTDPDKLRKQLAQIRVRKCAIAVDELGVGASAAASPIFDRKGRVIASLTISCPTSRFPKSIQAEYTSLLVAATVEIHRHFD